METRQKVFTNEYRDSVTLMQMSNVLASNDGVEQASMVMATSTNLELLRDAGLLSGSVDAGSNDMILVVQGDASVLEAVIEQADELLTAEDKQEESGAQKEPPRSISMALDEDPDLNLAIISVPGIYAAAETMKALRNGLHVMLFSDNVSEQDELEVKTFARNKDLIVMGPDCGTAIINGIPLAFANVVKKGKIGAVGASGTGLQQVTVLVDRLGAGISQAIGTGGHDLSKTIGGISMLQGIKALDADNETEVITLISKPPSPEVANKVLEAAITSSKPVVVNFLGMDPTEISGNGIFAAGNLEDCARMAVAVANGEDPNNLSEVNLNQEEIKTARESLNEKQQYIRGLYSGGTFCYEATLMMTNALDQVYSNTPTSDKNKIEDVWKSHEHMLVDLGDDVFTRGRPHPMIDHRLRNERIVEEAKDPETAVILLDIVLGYGSHENPAAEMLPAIEEARNVAKQDGRNIVFVGSVCGTEGDPQGLKPQEKLLSDASVLLSQSNAQAVKTALAIIN